MRYENIADVQVLASNDLQSHKEGRYYIKRACGSTTPTCISSSALEITSGAGKNTVFSSYI